MYFDCSNNQLTDLDVSKCTKLFYLYCYDNQLTTLDVSGNTDLWKLYCNGNSLTDIDVSNCSQLNYLYCYDNELTSLDVSNNPNLRDLRCYGNQITSLYVSSNANLEKLYCWENQLTELDLDGDTNLEDLKCNDNKLTSLVISNNVNLEELDCSNNQLTSLDVNHNSNLEYLNCSFNQITDLDVSSNSKLIELNCAYNQLSNIPEVTLCNNINYFWCDHNSFGDDDCNTISNIKSMEMGTFVYNPQMDDTYLSCGSEKLYIPHIATVYGWETKLIVDNGDDENRTVDVTIYKGGQELSDNSYTVSGNSSLTIPLTDGDCGIVTYRGVNLSVRVSYIHTEGKGIAEFKLSGNASEYLTFKMPQYLSDKLTWIGLALMNPTDEDITVTLKSYSKSGYSMVECTKELSAFSKDAEMVEDFFDGVSRNAIAFVTVTSDVPICGINISGANLSQLLFTKASGDRGEYSTLYLPHIADVFDMWNTYLIFDNDRFCPSGASIYLYDGDGNEVVSESFEVIGSYVLNLNDYADLGVKCGTIKLSGAGMHVRVSYVDNAGGTAEFELGGKKSKKMMFTFPGYASDILDWMGIAIYNPGENDADVNLVAYKDGEEVGNVNLTVSSHRRVARMLNEIFTPYPSNGIDYVVAYSTEPITGLNISGSGLDRLLFTKGIVYMDELK